MHAMSVFVKTMPEQVAAAGLPVNRRIPIARNRLEKIRKILGI